MERNLMDWSHLRPSRSNILPYIPLQSSSNSVHMNIDSDNHVIIFTSDEKLWLAVTGWRELEQVGRLWDAFSLVIPTIHGTCLCGLSVEIYDLHYYI
jgi:hypothetical protein